jgi:hypothetical protein
MLGMGVEDVGGEGAGGGVADELEVVLVFADLDERAAVRGDVDVGFMSFVIVIIVVIGTGGKDREGEEGEDGG